MSAHQTEKKKLLKRLTGFCAAFGDNLSGLEPALVMQIEDSIKQLSAPKKVAVAGLTDSGHYELASFLLGIDLIAAETAYGSRPTVHVRHGAVDTTHAVFGEKVRSLKGCAIDDIIAAGKPDRIELELAIPIVADISFTIMPAYDADEDRAAYIFELLNDVDVLIWCSNATKQWHSRERRLWFTIPDELKSRSILALTEADRLDTTALRTAFDEKCNLVMEDFSSLCSISTEAAKQAAPGGNLVDPSSFAESGAQELLGSLKALLSACDHTLLGEVRALRVELDAIPLGGDQVTPLQEKLAPLKAATSAASEPIAKTSETSMDDPIKSFLETSAKACIIAAEKSDADDFTALFEAMETLLSGLTGFLKDGALPSNRDVIAVQLEEASDLVGLLKYENDAKAAKDGADIVHQISADFWNCLNNPAEQNVPAGNAMKKAS